MENKNELRFHKNFLSSIPVEMKDEVLNRVYLFNDLYKQVSNYTQIPKGYWTRRVEGTNIYKFRINQADRVIYKLEHESNEPIYLKFCRHDDQIRIAKGYEKSGIDSEIYIEHEQVSEKEEEILDEYIRNELWNGEEYLLDDEGIAIGVESDNLDDKKYLSLEQYDCIRNNDAQLIYGCAGSGKTLVAIRKLLLEEEKGFNTIYLTSNRYLKQSSFKVYQSFCEAGQSRFYTIEELCLEYLCTDASYLIDYVLFNKWYQENIYLDKQGIEIESQGISSYLMWGEIQEVIKGSCQLNERMLTIQDYRKIQNSNIALNMRDKVYGVAISYDKWLRKNSFIDVSDLMYQFGNKVKHAICDIVVYDEIQELNNKELDLIRRICNKGGYYFIGDENQRVSLPTSNVLNVLSLFDERPRRNILNRNYRNGDGIIKFLNQLKMMKKDFKSNKYLVLDEAVKTGNAPYLLRGCEDISIILNKIQSDAKAIIIIGNNEIREELKKLGIKVERIMTIEESRGVEYDKVYCYRLVEYCDKFDNMNMLYIASSRAIKELYFLESKENELLNNLEEYCSNITLDEILELKINISDKKAWLEEAQNLERYEKYDQAIIAYEFAGEYERAMLCKKALDRKYSMVTLEEKGFYIDIKSRWLSVEKIISILEVLEKRNIFLQSWVQINCYFTDNTPRVFAMYIKENASKEEIAKVILDILNPKVYKQDRLAIKCISSYDRGDLLIKLEKSDVQIIEQSCLEWREQDKRRKERIKEHLERFGFLPKSDIEYIETDSVKTTSEEALNFIFGL